MFVALRGCIPTFLYRNSIFAEGSPISCFASTFKTVNPIYTLSMDTWIWAAIVNIDITVVTSESFLTSAAIIPIEGITLVEM